MRLNNTFYREKYYFIFNVFFQTEIDGGINSSCDWDEVWNKLDLIGLPNFNFACLWQHLLSSPSYYPEAIFQNVVSALSALCLKVPYAITRDIHGKDFEDPLFTNMYTMCLLRTGGSKGLSYKPIYRNVVHTKGEDVFLPTSPSPELVRKLIATEMIERKVKKAKKSKKGKDEEEPEEAQESGLVEIRIDFRKDLKYPGWRCLWDEEAGAYWASFKKNYMFGSEPMLCGYYSHTASGKGNIGKEQGETCEYICDDPFLAVNFLTVPENMRKLGYECITNGLIPRFIVMLGEYFVPLPAVSGNDIDLDKELDMFENIGKVTPEDIKVRYTRKALENASLIIASLFNPAKYGDEKLQVEIHEDAFTDIIDWEINMKRSTRNNPHITNMRSRHMENAYKLAILLTIGNLPYYITCQGTPVADDIPLNRRFEDIKDIDAYIEKLAAFDVKRVFPYKISRLVVPPDIMRFALKMFDSIYLPHALKAVDKMLTNYEDADAEKVLELFDNAPLIPKSDLLLLRDGIVAGYMRTYEDKPPKGVAIDKVNVYAEEQADKMLEIITALADDCEIAFMRKNELGDKARRHRAKTEGIVDTFIQYNVIIPLHARLGKSCKPTHAFIYIKGRKNDLKMPEKNFMDYTGNGKFYAGVQFTRVFDYGDLSGMNEAVMKAQGLSAEGSFIPKPAPVKSFAELQVTEAHPTREKVEPEDYIEGYVEIQTMNPKIGKELCNKSDTVP